MSGKANVIGGGKSRGDVRRLTLMAIFAAISSVLMYFEFPLPFLPPFLKLDLSGVATTIAAFLFGPWQAVLIILVKNLVHLTASMTGGVGELADFIILSAFAVSASVIYHRRKNKKYALLGCLAATLIMVVAGVFVNKFLLIPFYSKIMPIEAILGMCAGVNPAIDSLNAYYLFGVVPFNFIKGLLLSTVTFLCYKKLRVILKKENE